MFTRRWNHRKYGTWAHIYRLPVSAFQHKNCTYLFSLILSLAPILHQLTKNSFFFILSLVCVFLCDKRQIMVSKAKVMDNWIFRNLIWVSFPVCRYFIPNKALTSTDFHLLLLSFNATTIALNGFRDHINSIYWRSNRFFDSDRSNVFSLLVRFFASLFFSDSKLKCHTRECTASPLSRFIQ